jgi:hypothetical protein
MKKFFILLLLAAASILSAAPKNAARERIVIAEPRAISGVSEADIQGISEYLESKLGGNYEIFSRTSLKAISSEMRFVAESGMVDDATRQKLAQKSVNCILVYSISKLGSRLSLTMMVVDSSTGEIRKGQRASVTALSLDELIGRLDSALDSMGLLAGSAEPAAKKLAVLPVEAAEGVQGDIPGLLHAKVSSFLLKSGVFELVSREDLDRIAKESQLVDGSLTASGQFSKIGQLQLADYLAIVKVERYDHYAVGGGTAIAGEVSVAGRMTIQLTVRIVDVKDGKVIASESLRDSLRSTEIPPRARREWLAADYDNAFLEQAAAAVGNYLLDRLDPVLVAAVDGNSIYLTRGSGAGIYNGQYYNVFNPGKQIVHPKTGRVLGAAESYAGTIQIVQVTPDLSIAAVCDKLEQPIVPGAKCRLAEPSAIGARHGIAPEPPPPPPAYPMAN